MAPHVIETKGVIGLIRVAGFRELSGEGGIFYPEESSEFVSHLLSLERGWDLTRERFPDRATVWTVTPNELRLLTLILLPHLRMLYSSDEVEGILEGSTAILDGVLRLIPRYIAEMEEGDVVHLNSLSVTTSWVFDGHRLLSLEKYLPAALLQKFAPSYYRGVVDYFEMPEFDTIEVEELPPSYQYYLDNPIHRYRCRLGNRIYRVQIPRDYPLPLGKLDSTARLRLLDGETFGV